MTMDPEVWHLITLLAAQVVTVVRTLHAALDNWFASAQL